MNKLIFTFLLGSISLFAQEKLIVDYEYKNVLDLSNQSDKEAIQLYKNMMNRKNEFTLLVSKDESIYKAVEKINNTQEEEGESISYIIPGQIFYKNLKANESLTFQDYNGRKFLIQDTISSLNWTFTKESSMILGYSVKKATASKNKFIYEAWYATDLAFRNGPAEFGGLPGLILKLEITVLNKHLPRKDIYQAVNIKINDKLKIEKPNKGEKVTRFQFKEITENMFKNLMNSNDKMDKKID